MQVISAKQILLTELQKRSRSNAQYSLRAFSKSLGLSPSYLSLIFSGQREPSKATLDKIVEKLMLDEPTKQALLRHKFLSKYSKNEIDITSQQDVVEFQKISLETFALISEWHHFAILSLLELPKSKFDVAWIAKRLGISQDTAKEAMDRLLALGIVGRVGKRWKQVGKPLMLENTVSTVATKTFHEAHLHKARHSLLHDSISIREHNGITLAMDPNLIPQIKQKLKKFRHSLMKWIEQNGRPKRVYHLGLQIYPIDIEETSSAD